MKSEVERILNEGNNVIFDVDVVGGCNIKKFYGDRALSVFIQPPSIDHLRERLEGRGTDTPEVIDSRIAKAEFELGFIPHFDVCIRTMIRNGTERSLEVIKTFFKRMNTNGQLPRKWGYIFALTGIAALGTCIAGILYKEYIIAFAIGLVFVGWHPISSSGKDSDKRSYKNKNRIFSGSPTRSTSAIRLWLIGCVNLPDWMKYGSSSLPIIH